MRVDSKVTVVTGAGTGMGRSLAIQLARQGSSVAICDINPTTLKETVDIAEKEKKNQNVKITSYVVDVSNEQAVKDFRDKVLADHNGKVDILINNAGIHADGRMIHPKGTSKEEIEAIEKAWERCFRINFYGVVYCTRAFLDVIIAQQEGYIANLSSINAMFTWPEHSCYVASKTAVKGFTEALYVEMEMKAPHVRVCCIHPGGVKTEIYNNALFQLKDEKSKGIMNEKIMDACDLTSDEAAEWILDGIAKDKTRIIVGYDAIGMDLMMRAAPRAPYSIYRTLGKLGVQSVHPDKHHEIEERVVTIQGLYNVITGGGLWFAFFLGWTVPMRLRRYPIIFYPMLATSIPAAFWIKNRLSSKL